MTLEECIDYAEKQSEWMSKYTMIDIYKDKSEYYRQLAEWLKELKAYEEAREEIGCLPIVWEEGAGIRKCIDILDKHLKEVNADDT